MAAMSFNTKEKTPIFTTASESSATNTTESYNFNEGRSGPSHVEGIFSPMAQTMKNPRGSSDPMNLLSQHEPMTGDPAPNFDDDMFTNMHINSNVIYEELEPPNNNSNGFFTAGTGAIRPEYDNPNLWGDNNSTVSGSGFCTSQTSNTGNGDMLETFDFLIKSLSSANQYVSMLTNEQLSVLRSIRPILLYELLVEVAKIRNEKRMRRALPNECAFCKNNGENEESYSSHALKDWRGRVLCPVLRAFRCPRCGATGDRAHTIKYCPESDEGLERSSYGSGRRRSTPSSILFGQGSLHSPATSTAPSSASMSQSSIWNPFGIN